MTAEELEEVKKVLTSQGSAKLPWWQKNLGTFITIIMITVGGVAAYAKSEADVGFLQEKLAKVERVQEKHAVDIENVKLNAGIGNQDVKHIKEQIDKMDKKLDKLLEAR